MRIKLKFEELSRLQEMIDTLLTEYPAFTPAEELIWVLVKKVKIRFRNRMDNIRPGYTITLPKEEALAFEFWMNEMRRVIQPQCYVYEQNTAQQITNEINKTYG